MRGRTSLSAGIGVLAMMIVAAVLPVSAAAADPVASEPAGLFSPVADTRAAGDIPDFVKRQRTVSVDVGMLFREDGNPKGRPALPEVSLDLFDDASFTGVITDVKTDHWAATWTGDLEGVEGGYFYLTVADGAFIAHVASPAGVYEVSSVGEGPTRSSK